MKNFFLPLIAVCTLVQATLLPAQTCRRVPEVSFGYTAAPFDGRLLQGFTGSLGFRFFSRHARLGVTIDALENNRIRYAAYPADKPGFNYQHYGLYYNYRLLKICRWQWEAGVVTGLGRLAYVERADEKTFFTEENAVTTGRRTLAADHFFTVQPQTAVSMRLCRKLRVGLNARYRLAAGEARFGSLEGADALQFALFLRAGY
jgi:hypothetical protein